MAMVGMVNRPVGAASRICRALEGSAPVVREGAAQGLGSGVRVNERVTDGGVYVLSESAGAEEPVDVLLFVPGVRIPPGQVPRGNRRHAHAQ